MKKYKFVDYVTVSIFAGRGGNGCVSFRREKYVPRGGPDGGDGGRGGHVIFHAGHNMHSLTPFYYKPRHLAENGGHGKGKRMHGRNGKDVILGVPCGTEIRDDKTNELLGDLINDGAEIIVAYGGQGGLGNCHWKTNTHQAPVEHTEGEPGEQKKLRLDLKMIGDVGLIGFPNAGKSTLISAISHAHPKIASYPFTTLTPIIGTIKYDTFTELKVVDIPGLIKGAHSGSGLGFTFLRHVERTRLLAFIIDMGGTEGRHPADDYTTLVNEIKQYNPVLAQYPSLIIANKMDIPEANKLLQEFINRTTLSPIPISALKGQGVDELKQVFYDLSMKQKSNR